MSENTPTLKVIIDGQELQVPKGWSIIQAADEAGIPIPRFCYHKKLRVAANCRMCLVDVEGARKPTPACATPVAENMVVYSKSQKTIQYQKAVMEFLLINHPLDCPVCDQGGECELQDVAMGYGKAASDYTLGKRVVPKKDIGPLIETDLTRCIHCTRCVRFGADVAGVKELGMIGRGEHSEIATFLDENVTNELSGNVIDLCPVGALTSKPFRYRARAWEMQQHPMIAPHDCIGSNMNGHVRRGDLLRIVPRENEALNETWLSDRDRFSYQSLNNLDLRATEPKIKREGEWEVVTWQEAFEFIVKKFNHIANEYGAEHIGALASPSSTTEEFYLLQKLMRAIGSQHVDHRLRQQDDRQLQGYGPLPGIDCSLSEIQAADVIVVLGSDSRRSQPILHHRFRQAALQGADITLINPVKFERRFEAQDWLVNADDLLLVLAELVKAHSQESEQPLSEKAANLLSDVKPSQEASSLASKLHRAQRPVLLVGEGILNHPDASNLLSLFALLKTRVEAKGGLITEGANTAGAWLAGCVPILPHQNGKNKESGYSAKKMLTPDSQMKAMLLLNTEPHLDSAFGLNAVESLQNTECVIALTAYETEGLQSYADVILPIAAFAETDGTYVNAFGDMQTFKAVAKVRGEAKPAWKVLRVMANFLDVAGFEYIDIEAVRKEALSTPPQLKNELHFDLPLALPTLQKQLKRYASVPLYASDMVVRYAQALQATQEAKSALKVAVNPQLANSLNLEDGCEVLVQQGERTGIQMTVKVTDEVAGKTVWVPQALEETLGLGVPFEQISVVRV